jgi:SAM-dependent methyltransferase
MTQRDLNKAALRGEPSYIWRAGQTRRLEMILHAAAERVRGRILENGCGVGMYVERLAAYGGAVIGLEYDFERVTAAHALTRRVICAAGESLPFPADWFDLVLSHEVLEHVSDDRLALEEIARVLKSGGRLILFVPNRGYPFETHGIYWRGRYVFGNIPLVNYLPRLWRDRLAPHVRVYTSQDLQSLISGLPFRPVLQTVVFGAYDNVIQRFGLAGKCLRFLLHVLERTPLRRLGLSHFWVLEKEA